MATLRKRLAKAVIAIIIVNAFLISDANIALIFGQACTIEPRVAIGAPLSSAAAINLNINPDYFGRIQAPVKDMEQTGLGNYELYGALLNSGANDAEIITTLKQKDISAANVLKAAATLDRDMASVARAMETAGYAPGEIVASYVAKALDWTEAQTLNLVNCSILALKNLLKIHGKNIDEKQLAQEVILEDILAEGKVTICGKDVVSSMYALRRVAAKHNVKLEGYEIAQAALMEMDNSVIANFNGRWVQARRLNNGKIKVIDSGNIKTMTAQEFSKHWGGKILTDKIIENSRKLTHKELSKAKVSTIQGSILGLAETRKKVKKAKPMLCHVTINKYLTEKQSIIAAKYALLMLRAHPRAGRSRRCTIVRTKSVCADDGSSSSSQQTSHQYTKNTNPANKSFLKTHTYNFITPCVNIAKISSIFLRYAEGLIPADNLQSCKLCKLCRH